MSQRLIEISISPEGQTTVSTRGFVGSTCREASRLLEQALGDKTAETLTAEFYQTENNSEQVKHEQ